MKFGYTIIYVRSVPETLSFYSSAFGLPIRFCVPSEDYGELDLPGSTTLAFAKETFVEQSVGTEQFQLNRKEKASAGVEIALMIDEESDETVESVMEQAVAAGATLVKKPVTKSWGQTVGYVKDCNGFLVEICTPMGS